MSDVKLCTSPPACPLFIGQSHCMLHLNHNYTTRKKHCLNFSIKVDIWILQLSCQSPHSYISMTDLHGQSFQPRHCHCHVTHVDPGNGRELIFRLTFAGYRSTTWCVYKITPLSNQQKAFLPPTVPKTKRRHSRDSNWALRSVSVKLFVGGGKATKDSVPEAAAAFKPELLLQGRSWKAWKHQWRKTDRLCISTPTLTCLPRWCLHINAQNPWRHQWGRCRYETRNNRRNPSAQRELFAIDASLLLLNVWRWWES